MSTNAFITNPLVQFFAAAAVIFGLYAYLGGTTAETEDTITITLAEQNNVAALFEKTWQRPPTPEELRGLIDSRLQEELYYREALALGLDDGDVIVRRRLAQKVEFIADDLAARQDPTDEDLTDFLKENADNYAIEPTVTFEQVYLSTDRRGPNLMDDAAALTAELERGADPAVLGDVIDLPRNMEQVPVSAVSRLFGEAFGETIGAAETGSWFGPTPSAYGAHLVRISAREPGRASTLDEARAAVERDWREVQRQEAREAYTEALKQKYQIEIEQAGSEQQ
jgi:hypothetical protein